MKTSKLFYGIALASLVSFTATADNTPSDQTSSGGQSKPTQGSIVIKGTTKGDNDNRGPKPAPKPTPPPAPSSGDTTSVGT